MSASNVKIKIFRGKCISELEQAVNNFCDREDILVQSVDIQTTNVGMRFNTYGAPVESTFFDTVMITYQEVENESSL